MENKKSTLRFIYPQWQGGIVDHWMPDIPAEDSSRGYYLGASYFELFSPWHRPVRIRSKFRFH